MVSGAAGAVGYLAGQIAKIYGCRVFGIAGGRKKCDWRVSDLGFDVAIDYKTEGVRDSLRLHCPEGIDVFFDNVGDGVLDAVLARLALHARIICCGAIFIYDGETKKGLQNYAALMGRRARSQGYIVNDYFDRYKEARNKLSEWINASRLKHKADVQEGFKKNPNDFPSFI